MSRITAEELEAIAHKHRAFDAAGDELCWSCATDFPCDTIRLVEQVRALEVEQERLRTIEIYAREFVHRDEAAFYSPLEEMIYNHRGKAMDRLVMALASPTSGGE